tara:strand:+ start:7253 stop:9058 length:1806 start_codon:yes stop_codon:yes gene_type:complete
MAKRVQTDAVKGYGSFRSSGTASRIDAFSGAPAIEDESSLSKLSKSFGLLTASVAKTTLADAKKAKDEKDLMDKSKIRGLAEKYKKEKDVLSKIKVGKLHPEFSLINQLALTQAIAANKTDKFMASFINEINSGTHGQEPWLNKKEFGELIETQRAELLDEYSVGKSDDGQWLTNEDGTRKTFDFAYEGAINSFDTHINTHKREWEAKRAKYQKDKFIESHKGNTARALNFHLLNPTNGKIDFNTAYNSIEKGFKTGEAVDSITNEIRKKAIFEQIIETSLSQTDPKNGYAILNNIPIKFQDRFSIDVMGAAKKKIDSEALRLFNASKAKREYQLTEGLRNGEGIILDMLQGSYKTKEGGENYGVEDFSKATTTERNTAIEKFIKSQDKEIHKNLFNYARTEQSNDDSLINPSDSNLILVQTQENIMQQAAMGKLGSIFNSDTFDSLKTSEQLKVMYDYTKNLDITKSDRQKLNAQLPILMEGSKVTANKQVITHFNDNVKDIVLKFAKGLEGGLEVNFSNEQAKLSNMRRIYNTYINNAVLNHIEENKRLPIFNSKGDENDLQLILDEATNRAIKFAFPNNNFNIATDIAVQKATKITTN